MAQWFEDLSKTVSDDKLTRRQAVRRMVGVVAGATLATWLPEQALATNLPWKKQCSFGGNCDGFFTNCNGNPNTNCFCFTSIEGKGVCACNALCSQLQTCTSSSQCKKSFICIVENGCSGCGTSPGVCVAKCKGKHKNCTLGSGHGTTVVGRAL